MSPRPLYPISPELVVKAHRRDVPLEVIELVLTQGQVVHSWGHSELHLGVRGCPARVVTVEGRAVSCYWHRRGEQHAAAAAAIPEVEDPPALPAELDAILRRAEHRVDLGRAFALAAMVVSALAVIGSLVALYLLTARPREVFPPPLPPALEQSR